MIWLMHKLANTRIKTCFLGNPRKKNGMEKILLKTMAAKDSNAVMSSLTLTLKVTHFVTLRQMSVVTMMLL